MENVTFYRCELCGNIVPLIKTEGSTLTCCEQAMTKLAVNSEGGLYRCELCRNIVALTKTGGDTLTCCGQVMTKLTANSTDAAQEKHVPVVVIEENMLKVTVGSVIHPMTPEHHIEWIMLAADDTLEIKHLAPGMEPKAEFAVPAANAVVYAYCNLHGLWKAEL